MTKKLIKNMGFFERLKNKLKNAFTGSLTFNLAMIGSAFSGLLAFGDQLLGMIPMLATPEIVDIVKGWIPTQYAYVAFVIWNFILAASRLRSIRPTA